MGAAGSVEGGEACSQIVTVEQASEIMSIVFSKQVTHSALREFLATARRDMIDDATVRQIIEVLEKPSAASVQQQQQAQQQQQQQQQPIAAGTLAERVKAAFYGQFDSVKQAFHNADVNGGGSISHEEFAEAVRAGGLEISDEDVAAAAASIDTNHDGSINYTEFLRFLTDSSQPDEYAQNAVSRLLVCFRLFVSFLASAFDPLRCAAKPRLTTLPVIFACKSANGSNPCGRLSFRWTLTAAGALTRPKSRSFFVAKTSGTCVLLLFVLVLGWPSDVFTPALNL